MAVKKATQDTANWPEIKRFPPCGHKQWVRVSRMEGTVVYLQCKRCWGPWRTDLDWHEKCPGHFSGGCEDENCKHVHIFRARPKRRRNHNKRITETAQGGDSDYDEPPQLCDDDVDVTPLSVPQQAAQPFYLQPVYNALQQQHQANMQSLSLLQAIPPFVAPAPTPVTFVRHPTNPTPQSQQQQPQPVRYIQVLPMAR